MDNSLDIWILEAKGLPIKKKYFRTKKRQKKNEVLNFSNLDIMSKSLLMKIFSGKQRAKNDERFFSGEKIFFSKIFPKVVRMFVVKSIVKTKTSEWIR